MNLPPTSHATILHYLTTKTYKRGDSNLSNTAGTVMLEISAIKDMFRRRKIPIGQDLNRELERFSKGTS